eukprot:COSAG01_NODE_21856_length_882_cov_0.868455_2_plen_114_part_00
MVCIAELEECRRSFVLLLLAVKVQAWDVDVVQKLTVILYRVARREKYDNFSFLQVFLQKREEQQEPDVTLADDIALLQTFYRRKLCLLLDSDVHGSLIERKFCKVLNFVGLGC